MWDPSVTEDVLVGRWQGGAGNEVPGLCLLGAVTQGVSACPKGCRLSYIFDECCIEGVMIGDETKLSII